MSRTPRSARARRGVLAAAFAGAVTAALLVPPAGPVQAAAPTNCTATGGTVTTIKDSNGIFYNVHTFTSSGSFTPPQTVPATYLVVSGGGGGGPVSNRRMAGGGGGGGDVVTGSADLLGSAHTITVGGGGTAGTGTTQGGTGGTSSIVRVSGGVTIATAAGGGGGGAGATNRNGVNGAAGGGGGGATVATTGGTGSPGGNGGAGFVGTNTTRAGAGGGGRSAAGSNGASSTGGAGGAGTASSITGTSVTYGGGGGGGGSTTAGAGGSGGGGAGGNATLATRAGNPGTANTGGGGGGAGNHTASGSGYSGGAGGTGVVIIRYPKYCGVPSAPTSVSFSSPTLSWGAPAFVPTGQSVTSYTVTYKNQADGNGSSGWGIYARGSAATSINVTGKTISDCTSNNPGWTCVLTNSNLVSGQTYVFRVFARTASTLGRSAPIPTATQLTYTVP